MSKKKGRRTILNLFQTLIAVICCVGCASQVPAITVPATPDNILDIQAIKSRLDMVFIPAEPFDMKKAKVSKEKAIAKAQEVDAPLTEPTGIFAELGYLSDPTLDAMAAKGEKVHPALLTHPLVWIVSYEGVNMPSNGPPGEHHIAHEYNVVIDAMTGEYIMGFIYR